MTNAAVLQAKLIATVAIVLATIGGVVVTSAAFTDTVAAETATSAGTVDVIFDTTTVANDLLVNATALVPGDTIQRALAIKNAGTVDWASLSLTTTAPTSSLLDTDATDGLQLVVESCPNAWTKSGTPPTYTCSVTPTTVVASRPVIGSDISLGALGSLTAGGIDYLRVTLSFPTAAGNTFQGANSSINFAFNATQRTATNR